MILICIILSLDSGSRAGLRLTGSALKPDVLLTALAPLDDSLTRVESCQGMIDYTYTLNANIEE